MKKLLLLLTCIGSFTVFAQQWVETTPKPRKVVLEEFTAINCQFCPDGHRVADQMVAANPGNLFLINIHSGSLAKPSSGQPDYRTTAGDVLTGFGGITGYPTAAINRSSSPWGQGRDLWSSLASGIMTQTSPVNVAVRAYVDIPTRTLTTEVEVYYTANASTSANSLSIVLTQDDILGPQVDGGNYYPSNWVGNQYKHNHVFRQMITSGYFGESIDTTTVGHYVYRKYVTQIPADYKGIKAVLSRMNVVAFVSQGETNILSGAGAKVDFDAAYKTDLSILDKSVVPSTMCGSSVNPKVEVTNASAQTISSFDITAIVNGTSYKKTIIDTLAAGAKVIVDWGESKFTTGGKYLISIGKIENVRGISGNELIDIEDANNGTSISGVLFMDAPIPANNIWCGFEKVKGVAYDQTENAAFEVISNSSTSNYGCWSKSAMLFYLHNSWKVEGKPGHILLGKVDLAAMNKPGISYYYAYSDGELGGTAPIITVNISKDCGSTWTKVSDITAEETGKPADLTELYAPPSTDYKLVKVDLDAYTSEKILAKISVTPGTNGNSLFIDEIAINSFGKLGLNEAGAMDFGLIPNPASGRVTLNLSKVENASYVITNITGKQIQSGSIYSMETSINLEELANGVYFVEIINSGVKGVQKLVISK